MKIKRPKLSEDDVQRIKRYFTTKDYETVAERSGYCFSSCYNVLNGTQGLTPQNQLIILEAYKMIARKSSSAKEIAEKDRNSALRYIVDNKDKF